MSAALALLVALAAAESPLDAGLPEPLELGDAGEVADAGDSHPLDAGPVADAGAPPRLETVVFADVDLRRVAGSAQVIGHDELERREQNDVHRVLQSVPGVYVRDEEGFGLRPNIGMRGVNPERSSKITLMEDGVLAAPAPYAAPAAYNFPLVTRMTAIEVYKGPASIRHGPQTIGGAINLRTRAVPQQAQADADVSFGNYGARKLHGSAGIGNDRLGVLVEAANLGSTGFKQLPGGADTGFDKSELMLKARASTDPAAAVVHAAELKLEYGTERSNDTYLGLSVEDFEKNPYGRYPASAADQMRWWRSQAVLTYTLTAGEAIRFSAVLYRTDFQRTWHRFLSFRRGPDLYQLLAYPSKGTTAEPWVDVLAGRADSQNLDESVMVLDVTRRMAAWGAQATLMLRAATGPVSHDVEAGVRVHADDIRRHHHGSGYAMTRGVLLPDGEPDVSYVDNVGEARTLAVHLADTLSVGRLTVSPGARLELIRVWLKDELAGTGAVPNESATPLLGLGAVYTFDFGLAVLAGVHQGFSPVTPGQAASVRPERAINSETGVRFGRAGLRAEAILFWSEYQNITGECTFAEGCLQEQLNQQFNGGTARVLGLELLAGGRWRLPGQVQLFADVVYTFTSAKFLESFNSPNPIWKSVTAGDELPYIPAHQGQVRARVRREPAELSLSAAYYGETREQAGAGPIPDAVRVPQRVLVEATASVDWGAARLYFTATNLLGTTSLASRRPFGARPQAPMMFQLGLKYSFR
ncbi:MAG: TonB-dependent receptor [Archangiaceae bacterium]|nr:TonB-dependent receptor [Archangiaceae bacterium]